MFSKISRYRKVPDITVPDVKGRLLNAKDIRLQPDVTGTFRHMVNAGDRLDQLASKYYDQALQWWNICDANPDFVSPLALLGQEPVVTTLFPVTAAGAPPWFLLLQVVSSMVGVEDIRIAEDVQLVPQQSTTDGQTITIFAEHFSFAVLVTYNRLNVTTAAIAASVTAAGFQIAPFTDLGQVGQEIIIPPKPIG